MKRDPKDAAGRRGQVLAGVLMLVMVLLIMVPAMVQWIQIETKAAVRSSRTTRALNLAQAGIERGSWRVKASSAAFDQATAGTVIAGYNNDTTYTDVAGGTYRIKLSSGGAGSNSFTVVAEGRDEQSKEVRAVQAVFKSQTIYSPIMATGRISASKTFCPFWGPMMSQGDINIMDDAIGNLYFPRKMAKGTVNCTGTCTNSTNGRDTNGLTPPNTDNVEWWSDYRNVPDIPIIDFATLRSSAATTKTLNIYGCKNGTAYTDPVNGTAHAGAAPWDTRGACINTGSHPTATASSGHFCASSNHPKGVKNDPSNTYVWYYDGDVILGGGNAGTTQGVDYWGNKAIGLRGTLIVRGNLTLDAGGDYLFTGPVPANAWAEFGKLTKTTADNSATGQYPADNGYQTNKLTMGFGNMESYSIPGTAGSYVATVGLRGFTYVGGDLTITSHGFLDFVGAVWVNGNVNTTGSGFPSSFCGIFFDDTLDLPTLNVVLSQQSWKEIAPSSAAWP